MRVVITFFPTAETRFPTARFASPNLRVQKRISWVGDLECESLNKNYEFERRTFQLFIARLHLLNAFLLLQDHIVVQVRQIDAVLFEALERLADVIYVSSDGIHGLANGVQSIGQRRKSHMIYTRCYIVTGSRKGLLNAVLKGLLCLHVFPVVYLRFQGRG